MSPPVIQDRAERARSILASREIDALLVTSLPTIRYISGFTGSDGALLLTGDETLILVDGRYVSQAAEESPGIPVVCYRSKGEGIAEQILSRSLSRIGIEGERMTVLLYETLREKLAGCHFVLLRGECDDLRIVKTDEEIALIRQAASIAGSALQELFPLIAEGVCEEDLATELEYRMRRLGAEGIGFETIVASGTRGALPHGRGSRKRIAPHELVTIDYGAVVGGYHSDETVTLAVGSVDQRLRDIYETVREAHDRAIEAVRPGVPLREIDAAARDFIASKGYGEYFGHGLGHGVGLEIHERPTLNPRSDDVAVEGAVFTVEPGIYIPGLGGVRIEDTVVVTSEGARCLTTVSKEFMEL